MGINYVNFLHRINSYTHIHNQQPSIPHKTEFKKKKDNRHITPVLSLERRHGEHKQFIYRE